MSPEQTGVIAISRTDITQMRGVDGVQHSRISSGLYLFLAITVLLDVKDIHGRSVIWLTAARDSKLMFGALIHAAERWRGLRFTEFELRQIAAMRIRR